jgi:hypothetical protein
MTLSLEEQCAYVMSARVSFVCACVGGGSSMMARLVEDGKRGGCAAEQQEPPVLPLGAGWPPISHDDDTIELV